MIKKSIKVGLIGLGRMGQNHLRILSILKDVDLIFIADADVGLARRLGDSYGVRVLDDVSAIPADVEAIIICTPTVTHAEYIRLVASKVRNIFVEKPVASTLAEARDLLDFSRKLNLNLQIGFIERFNPAVQALKAVIDKTENVVSIDFTRTNKLSARITDVDVITDLMIHDIDLALFLNGPAKSVTAHGYSSIGMIDFASALITHSNGRFSRIQASRITDKKIRQIEATCIDMFVDCDLLRKEILISKQSQIQQYEGQPYTISSIQESVEVKPQEALLTELQSFITSCCGSECKDIPGVDAGVAAMEICHQIQEAVVRC